MRSLTLIAVLALAGCSNTSDAAEPAGSGTTRTFAISDFSAVSLRGSDDVDVRVGTGFSVRAEGPRTELDKLEIVRDGDTLKIGRKKNLAGFGWGGGRRGVKVFVTMPRITGAQVAGSGDLAIDRVDGQRFGGEAAGSGNLSIGALSVPEARLSVAGSGDIDAKGRVERLTIDVAGSGSVAAGGVKARTATVSVAGSGDVRADVAGPARVSLVGSGDVDLGPQARCTVSKTGSGDVHCGG
ncbi:head GIN domain-containing protein [Sphingomonas sp. PAMC 26617]|uniref:head GIN domain-containing protein n=1 Tax=Sphingomonas sp. PAMC 26617 TaxID=1112216 RepID=UPI000287F4F3|nr:head GIN domain-containing protein [Sphingomonas sp. PAMC 26617]